MLTISTFNCENLFSRSKLFDFEPGEPRAAALSALSELNAIIEKTDYSAPDKKRILELIDTLEPFIEINTLRSALFIDDAQTGERIVVARGRRSWVGGIELKRTTVPLAAQRNTAEILNQNNADIQLVVEVDDRRILEDFNATLERPFEFNLLIDGNDGRGIDVGILSRLPIVEVQTHIFDKAEGGTVLGDRVFSRDCLEVTLKLPDNRLIHVLVNHLKSKRSETPEEETAADALRTVQSKRLAEILKGYDLETDLVLVGGDFNDTPDSAALKDILSVPGLTSLVDQIEKPENRWTYHSKTFGDSQIDYLLVSAPLLAAFKSVDINRRGINGINPTNAAGDPVPSLPNLSSTTQASDHAAVIATFDL